MIERKKMGRFTIVSVALLSLISLIAVLLLGVSMVTVADEIFFTDYHELTEQEQQKLGSSVKDYYKKLDLPSLMEDYAEIEYQDELNENEPSYLLFKLYSPREYHYGMFDNCIVGLNNGGQFAISYGVIKGGKVVDHSASYRSPYFTCENISDAIEEIKNHTPDFEEMIWLETVFSDFYPEGTDVSAEWMQVYKQAVQEIDIEGLAQWEDNSSKYFYRFYKTVLTTESGKYNLGMYIQYYNGREWHYQYFIELEPIK